MALSAADQQLHARIAYGVAGAVVHVSPTGNDTTGDGVSWDTAYRTLAPLATGGAHAAGANDLIRLAGGHYAHVNVALISFASGCRIKGAGKDVTFLDFATFGVSGIGIVIEDLTITGDLTPDVYSQPIGAHDAGTITLNRVKTVSWSDGIQIINWTPVNLAAYDCDFLSDFDALNVQGFGGTYALDFFRCNLLVKDATGDAVSARCVHIDGSTGGRVRFFGGTMTARGTSPVDPPPMVVRCVLNDGTAAVELYGVNLRSDLTNGTAYDLENTSTGTILAVGCQMDTAKTNGSGITLVSTVPAPVAWSSEGNSFSTTDR